MRRPDRSVLMERPLQNASTDTRLRDLLGAESGPASVDWENIPRIRPETGPGSVDWENIPPVDTRPSEGGLFGAVGRFVSPSQEEAARRRAALAALLSEFMSPSMEGLEADLRSRGFDGEVAGAPLTGNLYTWRKAPPFPKLPRAGSDLRKMIRAVLGI